MLRANLLLLLAVLASALYLVHVQYESRRLFGEIEKALSDARQLEIENHTLEVEKRAQATPLRVEKVARAQLQLRNATPAITQYVKLDGGRS
jgi:cell division protein FtsL